jgi:hypothetical protein
VEETVACAVGGVTVEVLTGTGVGV